MRHFLAAALLAFVVSAHAADSKTTITLYAPSGTGANAKQAMTFGVVPGDYPFYGIAFDGDQKIGRIEHGHFVTLELPPGKHVFSVSGSPRHGDDKDALTIDAQAGKSYFVRMTATHKGAWVVQAITFHLEEVRCAGARTEADTTKPEKIGHIDAALRNDLVSGPYFPRCEETPSH